jgi:REP element-mobilizing transposase RayT
MAKSKLVSRRKRKLPVQLDLAFEVRAKARRRAGRKPGEGRGFVRHRVREAHTATHPVHVVLRSKFRPLRSQFVFPTLRSALAKAARAHEGFRIVQFSVQHDHLHLIVEGRDKTTLSRGMQGLAIRVARQVNRLVNRRGKLWADRFFSRALSSPRAVKHALAYVLNNFRKHATQAARAFRIDPYSSAPYFKGFRELRGRAPCELAPSRSLPLVPPGVSPPETPAEVPIVPAKTWFAQCGWRRAGLIAFTERSPQL